MNSANDLLSHPFTPRTAWKTFPCTKRLAKLGLKRSFVPEPGNATMVRRR